MAKPCSWYTVYSAKTDEIIAGWTADMIVQPAMISSVLAE